MAKDPAFLFYPGDYLRDTQCLSESVQVAYDRIMCEHMRNICISYDQLNFFTKRLTSEQKKELDQVLTKVNGGFQIEWVAESIAKRKNYSDSRRKNREGKKPKTKNISSSYVPHMENEIEDAIENEDWIKWGEQILQGEDIGWEQMRGRNITQDELDQFLSVAVRNEWKMGTQQDFRRTLHGFRTTKKTNSNGNGNSKTEHTIKLAKSVMEEYGDVLGGGADGQGSRMPT